MIAAFTKEKKVILELTRDEVALFNNALNEVCNGFELPKFEEKIGVSENNARILLRILSRSYDESVRLMIEN